MSFGSISHEAHSPAAMNRIARSQIPVVVKIQHRFERKNGDRERSATNKYLPGMHALPSIER
ncbi:hypothetical protein OK016_12035 [Vibrio chagasii]|nr:hypothetical protein [Vibrio chagasii]